MEAFLSSQLLGGCLLPLRPSAQVGPLSGCAGALCHASIQPGFEHSVKPGECRIACRKVFSTALVE